MLVTEILNTSNRESNKHLLKISCKNNQKLQRKKLEERTFGTPCIYIHKNITIIHRSGGG